jgi:hypothetical protein
MTFVILPILSAPKPLFIVGNKRSGSTLLVNMLNEHPQVAVTHETDIVWALYQCQNGAPQEFRPFPWDAPRGLEAMTAAFGDAIRELISAHPTTDELRRAFFEIQRRAIEDGTKVHVPLKRAAGLTWIGDKKPVQHSSPELREFMCRLFPDATFVHIIRHPFAVVASKQEAARQWPITPNYWKAQAAEVLDRWCVHEEWTLELKELLPNQVQTVRLEDLCTHPIDQMSKLFTEIGLEASGTLLERLAEFVYSSPNEKYSRRLTPPSAQAERIMTIYGYSTTDL